MRGKTVIKDHVPGPDHMNFSIKQKLTLIIMSLSTLALLLTSAAFIVYDIRTFKSGMVAELNTLAEIIGNNSTAAITFNDKETANEILSALKAKTHITTASILVNGAPMASYLRNRIEPVHRALKTEGHLFYKNRLGLLHYIFFKNKLIGSVYIESDLDEIALRLKNYLAAIIVIGFIVSVIIFFFASRIQRSISDPILRLGEITKNVSVTEDYTIEAKKYSDDEIGLLYDEFNKMMRNIQSRDLQLTQAKNDLERRVEERTEELRKSNQELQENQHQLLQSEKMASIGQLAAGVAHEINNPIGFVSNNMEILQEYVQNYTKILRHINHVKIDIDNGDLGKAKAGMEQLRELEIEINLDFMMNDVNKLLEHSSRGLERVRKIVLDLKTFAREDNVDAMESFKVEEVIDSILSIVQNELKYKGELVKDYGKTSFIRGNIQRLGQVLINLLLNAAQAIPERGIITIKTYRQDGYVCIDVSDTGEGIPEKNLKKIFDPFFTTKPVGKGTGLGLSVSYEIVKKHGGDIKVQSKEGVGTTFTVMLPMME